VAAPAAVLHETMVALFAELTPEVLRQLMTEQQGLLHLLPDDIKATLAEHLKPYRFFVRMMSANDVLEKVKELRSDLTPILNTPLGRSWLAREVRDIKAAILEVS